MFRDDFAIFILTHGRPNNIITLKTLQRVGYTGKIYLIIDDEDDTKDDYIMKYGKKACIIFNKQYAESKFDIMDNFSGNKSIVYARNVCNEIAKKLGLKYFAEFEDDYVQFMFRYAEGKTLKHSQCRNFDSICNAMIDFVDSVSAVQPKFRSIAFAQGGDFIGGVQGGVWKRGLSRKAMNTFFFKVKDDDADAIYFRGRMNDDVNAYTMDGNTGGLWFQISQFQLDQVTTQQNTGGNTEMYKDYGTYIKSFYSVMGQPSCVKINVMGVSHKRIHHSVMYNSCMPKIINEKYRKF